MPYRCLSEFLEDLSHQGELDRLEERVDPCEKIADTTIRSTHAGGSALLFAAVGDHDLPVATNILATEKRLCKALGVESSADIAERLALLLDGSDSENRPGWLKGNHATYANSTPKKVRAAPAQQIVRLGSDVDLDKLPLLKLTTLARSASEGHTSEEHKPEPSLALRAGVSTASIYSAATLTAEPDSRRPTFGRFDLQQLDRSRLAIGWESYDEQARLLGEYRCRDRKMPVAVVIGGPPAFQAAVAAPLPAETDVCALAGWLRGKPIDAADGRSIELEVPAEAEIIIEGHIDPNEPPVEVGPVVAPLGHCTCPRRAPVMQVSAVTHRANPIYAAYVPGVPPNEICTLDRFMQRAFLPLLRTAMPELVDYDLPEFAAGRHWVAVAIRKTYPGQGRLAAHTAWGLRPMRFAKTMVIVDADVDVRDRDQVLTAMTKHFRPGLDVIAERFPHDPYDPSPSSGELTERMAFDATRKLY